MIKPELAYPTATQVLQADRDQLLEWCRTLSDPGAGAWGEDDFADVKKSDLAILELIFTQMRVTRPPLLHWATPTQPQETTA